MKDNEIKLPVLLTSRIKIFHKPDESWYWMDLTRKGEGAFAAARDPFPLEHSVFGSVYVWRKSDIQKWARTTGRFFGLAVGVFRVGSAYPP